MLFCLPFCASTTRDSPDLRTLSVVTPVFAECSTERSLCQRVLRSPPFPATPRAPLYNERPMQSLRRLSLFLYREADEEQDEEQEGEQDRELDRERDLFKSILHSRTMTFVTIFV